MGSAAISSALVTEACKSDAKVLDPVVLVCGAARLAARDVIELVLLVLMGSCYRLIIGPVGRRL
jgi:hypothetical protein